MLHKLSTKLHDLRIYAPPSQVKVTRVDGTVYYQDPYPPYNKYQKKNIRKGYQK